MSYWKPETETSPRPSISPKQGKDLYLKSYLVMRAVIGFIGILLPAALLLGDWTFLDGDVRVRGSLSAYYHSGMRDLFVGGLCAIALFLITYKVFEHNLDNTLSTVAGLAILGVAFFPTGRPAGSPLSLTPLQDQFGESNVTRAHFVFAAISIVSLAWISYFFGVREGRRPPAEGKRPPGFWRWFHWICASVIALAVAFIVLTKVSGWFDDYSVLIGEVVALLAFGVSWLWKGLEMDVLKAPVVVPEGPEVVVAGPA